MRRLLLCAGGHREPGFVSHDGGSYHGSPPDISGIIPPLPAAIREQQWDLIWWRHGITSLYPWDAADVLTQLYRVLSADGILRLEQTDSVKTLKIALKQPEDYMKWVYGDPDLREPLHMLRWGYTKATLLDALEKAGFTYVQEVPPSRWETRDFAFEAHR